MMHRRQSEDKKMHRRAASHPVYPQIPPVVTVSALGELQSALIERDARISFLEKELVGTRMQLALAKTSEDQLLMKLNKMKLALAEATKNSRDSSISLVSEDDSSDESQVPV